YGLNASGRAGSLMTRAALLARGHQTMPEETVEDVTVPGALSGWDALLKRFGTITLAQALAPAIRYADEGFPVTPIIAREWADETEKLKKDDGARATFLVDSARAPRAPRAGEWFRNPDLARTLRLIADQGPVARYVGEPAEMTTPVAALLGDAFVAQRRAQIDPARAADRPAPGKAATASETIYLTVADSAGNMVSFINSLYDLFGSGVVVPGTG